MDRIPLKNISGNKFYLDDETWVLIKYPSEQQQLTLNDLWKDLIRFISNDDIENYKAEDYQKTIEQMSFDDKDKFTELNRILYNRMFRYCVKDWNIKDENNNIIPCKIVNNELEEDLYNAVIRFIKMDELIKIWQEIQFTINDKKKLSTEDNSTTKENLTVKE